MNARKRSRIQVAAIGLGAALLLGGLALNQPEPAQPIPSSNELRALRDRIEQRVATWYAADRLTRADGHAYTVDLAQWLLLRARRGDAVGYAELAEFARARLVLDRPDDPYTRGFVRWRYAADTPADASGTTEALRLAEALWRGGERFGRPADRALARVILDGYLRHATVERGTWLVRNYFNLGTRAFANDSYLVDYDPDLLAEAAGALDDAALRDGADRSYALLRAARSEAGLLHTLLQPDIGTVMPDIEMGPFSPNDVVQLNNACAVALTAVRGAPELGRGVLAFARARRENLGRYYLGRDGVRFSEAGADSSTWSCLLRLAAALDDAQTVRLLLPHAEPTWRYLLTDPQRRIYSAIEAILAIDAVLARPPSRS